MKKYEYIQALQLVDLYSSIMQLQAQAHARLSDAKIQELLKQKLRQAAEDPFDWEYDQFIEAGGDEDEFEGVIYPEQIERNVTVMNAGVK